MIKRLLSRYSLRYPRSLVYIMQASEYGIRDYFAWYNRVKDFRYVERRKQLVKTPKTLLLLVIAWGLMFFFWAIAVSILWLGTTSFKYASFLFIVFLAPYILAAAIVIPLFILNVFIQLPMQYLITRKAKQKLAAHKAFKIAIAGSFGKTTMREILKVVLSQGKKVAAPDHNYNTPIGISRFINGLKGDEEVLIFELGEYYPGDVRDLCKLVRPDMGIITGVNEAHLERFKNIDKTTDTIFELAQWLGEKPLYVNGENALAKNRVLPGHIVYTRNGIGQVTIESPFADLTGTSFVLVKDNKKTQFKSKLLGLHQIGALFVAIDIADQLGIPMEKIQKEIENTQPFDHRLESKMDSGGVITLDDSYNGNPDGVKAVLEFLSALKGHRRFYVTPGLVEMGLQKEVVHKEIGKNLAEAGIEKVVLIRNSVTGYIEEGLIEYGYKGEILWFEDALTAFAALPHLTVKGDVVLLQNDWPDQYE